MTLTDGPLRGRLALVTGCSRRAGIGFAIATKLAQLGADLHIHSYRTYDDQMPWGSDDESITPLLQELRNQGTQISHSELDLAESDAPTQLITQATQGRRHLDILIANHTHSTMGGLQDLTAEHIDQHLIVNVRATMLLAKAFASQHDGRRGGRVIMMTSGQHLHPMPDELAYIASKGALHPLTTSLSHALAAHHITVNTVNPGATDTGYADAELYEKIRKMEPQGRWGEPADVARLIGWLCTDDAHWITGQVINSTGGGP